MGSAGDRFFRGARAKPVVAGLRHSADVDGAIRHGVGVLFILGEDIFALQESVAKAHAADRLILAHVDLIKGIGRDEAGVRFLARDLQVDGILTTRANLIGPAKREGLIAVQRLFVLDSESLEAGLPAVERAAPDAVEVLPGVILPLIAARLKAASLPPLIAGGLIRTRAQVEEILAAGAIAVSTSEEGLWGFRGTRSRRPMKGGLADIDGRTFDLVVIGGGMAGAGIARDAALRGYRTLLLERKDFAFGTTSRSSKLIHGGLRYLELFDFGLVRESLPRARAAGAPGAPSGAPAAVPGPRVPRRQARHVHDPRRDEALRSAHAGKADRALPDHVAGARRCDCERYLEPRDLLGAGTTSTTSSSCRSGSAWRTSSRPSDGEPRSTTTRR